MEGRRAGLYRNVRRSYERKPYRQRKMVRYGREREGSLLNGNADIMEGKTKGAQGKHDELSGRGEM